jgi:UPF0271 protein
VLDTSALVVGFNPISSRLPTYSVPEVARELSLSGLPKTRFETAIELGHLKMRSPREESCKKVSVEMGKLGEDESLSEADFKILALALDLRDEGEDPVVVSDDYAIQNVAEKLGLPYSSLATFGISYEYNWVLFCPACYRRFPQTYPENLCGICGTRLRRKVLRKRQVKKKLGEDNAVA